MYLFIFCKAEHAEFVDNNDEQVKDVLAVDNHQMQHASKSHATAKGLSTSPVYQALPPGTVTDEEDAEDEVSSPVPGNVTSDYQRGARRSLNLDGMREQTGDNRSSADTMASRTCPLFDAEGPRGYADHTTAGRWRDEDVTDSAMRTTAVYGQRVTLPPIARSS